MWPNCSRISPDQQVVVPRRPHQIDSPLTHQTQASTIHSSSRQFRSPLLTKLPPGAPPATLNSGPISSFFLSFFWCPSSSSTYSVTPLAAGEIGASICDGEREVAPCRLLLSSWVDSLAVVRNIGHIG
jgi:hypothetical protein